MQAQMKAAIQPMSDQPANTFKRSIPAVCGCLRIIATIPGRKYNRMIAIAIMMTIAIPRTGANISYVPLGLAMAETTKKAMTSAENTAAIVPMRRRK